jgi:hypothetical protein
LQIKPKYCSVLVQSVMAIFSDNIHNKKHTARHAVLIITSKRNIRIQNILCYLLDSLKHATNKCPYLVANLFLLSIF